MIRKKSLNFKLNIEYHSSEGRFHVFMEKFCPDQERCPFCGAVGMCCIYKYYKRYIIDYYDGRVVASTLRVTRVICSCGHTHAILPDFIIPYRQYSLPFILHVLRVHLSRTMTFKKILDTFGVSRQLLGQWMRAFMGHKDLWLGSLDSHAISAPVFLGQLLDTDPFSGFSHGFYLKTLFSFLQAHPNPANCCQSPPGGLF